MKLYANIEFSQGRFLFKKFKFTSVRFYFTLCLQTQRIKACFIIDAESERD